MYRYLSNRALSVTRAAFEIIISGLQSRQSNSLDWRVGRSINKLHWRDTTRSAEQLSRSGAISSDHLQTPSTKYVVLSISFYYPDRIERFVITEKQRFVDRNSFRSFDDSPLDFLDQEAKIPCKRRRPFVLGCRWNTRRNRLTTGYARIRRRTT